MSGVFGVVVDRNGRVHGFENVFQHLAVTAQGFRRVLPRACGSECIEPLQQASLKAELGDVQHPLLLEHFGVSFA